MVLKKTSSMSSFFCLVLVGILCFASSIRAEDNTDNTLTLKTHLQQAQPGDFLVTAQNKNYTVLLIRSKESNTMSIDEITVPVNRLPSKAFGWRQWIANKAPGNTSWVMYTIDLSTGLIQQTFSFTRNEWITIPQSQNFLSTLLNLSFERVPLAERKRIGPPPATEHGDNRPFWQPPLIANGKSVANVSFDAWRTRWPKDGSDLSGKQIEIYLPNNSSLYPSYFPYWLQISGIVGTARVRIVDSGNGAVEPLEAPQLPSEAENKKNLQKPQ